MLAQLWNSCHEPSAVRPAVETILSQLGLEYVDLILIHWPCAFKAGDQFFPPHGNSFPADFGDGIALDTSTKLTDTWAALEACVDAGLVRAIGVSNFTTAEVDEVLGCAAAAAAVHGRRRRPHGPHVRCAQVLPHQAGGEPGGVPPVLQPGAASR